MMLHEFLERAFGEARPSMCVNESCTLLAGCERAIAIAEHRQSVQLEVLTRVNLHSRTVIAEIAGIPACRHEGS